MFHNVWSATLRKKFKSGRPPSWRGNNSTLIAYKCDAWHYIAEEMKIYSRTTVAAATAAKRKVMTKL